MGIELILTRKHDRDFNETGERIARAEWVGYVESAPDLRFRSAPHRASNPGTGATISVAPGKSETELLGPTGARPFLRFRAGDLVMGLAFDPSDPNHPVRRRVARVARDLGLLITHDAGDEILDW